MDICVLGEDSVVLLRERLASAPGVPVNALQFYISAGRLTDEINRSHESLRHRFLLNLSVGGSISILEVLLFHGLLLGDPSTYYFEKATKRGRLDIAFLCWITELVYH